MLAIDLAQCTTPVGVDRRVLSNPVVALATLVYHRLSK